MQFCMTSIMQETGTRSKSRSRCLSNRKMSIGKCKGTYAQFNDGENKQGKIKIIKSLIVLMMLRKIEYSKDKHTQFKKSHLEQSIKHNPLIHISIYQDQHSLSLHWKLPPNPLITPRSQLHGPYQNGIFRHSSVIFRTFPGWGQGVTQYLKLFPDPHQDQHPSSSPPPSPSSGGNSLSKYFALSWMLTHRASFSD